MKRVFLFSSFTGPQLTLISKRMTLASYPKGAALFQENDSAESLMLILSGSVRMAYARNKDTPPRYLSRGDCIGEMALLSGERRAFTAVAESTTEVLVLMKKDFDGILEKNPAIGIHLSRILSSRLAFLHPQVESKKSSSEVMALVLTMPEQDRTIFAANLALSLVQQTRKKVLLCGVEKESRLMGRALDFNVASIKDTDLRDGAIYNADALENLAHVHPSGLEFLPLDITLFSGLSRHILPDGLTSLRDNYDFIILAIPAKAAEAIPADIFHQTNKILLVAGPQSHPEALSLGEALINQFPSKQKERIWLSENADSCPDDFASDLRIHWKMEWGRQFAAGAPAFVSSRSMDRLARKLGSLTIGFAMGSGAAFGYALIGMLKVMEREGIYPDVISGTSMGALIGAFYSMGLSSQELEKIACDITRKKLWSMTDLIFPFRTGIIRGKGVLKFLRSHLGNRTFSDLHLPFSCVATDIETGREIVIDRGHVAEAVRASLSLPFFFEPFYMDGRYLVDGGLVNPVPTSIIASQGANILLSANLTARANERKVPGLISRWKKKIPFLTKAPSIPLVMMKTMYTMQYEISQARSEIAHVVMDIKPHDLLWWDLHRAAEMIRVGEASAEEHVAKIKSLLPYFSNACQTRISIKGRKTP